MSYNIVLPSSVSVSTGTSPALTDLNGLLYLFYMGSGGEGIWYTAADNNKNWSKPQLVTGKAKGNPSVVQFNGKIWLFYVPENTTWMNYQTFDGTRWSSSNTIGHDATLLDRSSPAAAVFNGLLYVFFNGSANNGVWYKVWDGDSVGFSGQIHCPARGLSLWNGTSPAPVAYQNELYLFFSGGGNDGTWLTTFDGNSWSNAISLRSQNNCSFEKGTSPTTFLTTDGQIVVMWSGSGKDGTWFSSLDGRDWSDQESLSEGIGGQDLMDTTNAPGYSFGGKDWIFWSIKGGRIGEVDGDVFNA